jgi:RNA polymerase sigma factor (sigma-70 family)
MSGGVGDGQVYEQCAPDLIRFATSLVGPSDAADVVSEAVIQVMHAAVWSQALDRRALLFRAVLLRSNTWRRSEGRRVERHARAAGLATVVEMEPPRDDVHTALRVLSHQQRAVVFLTYWQDLDPTAVADVLGVSEGTVRKQLARARSRLREVLS